MHLLVPMKPPAPRRRDPSPNIADALTSLGVATYAARTSPLTDHVTEKASADTTHSCPSLRIQTVLFGNSLSDVERFISSAGAATVAARRRRILGPTCLAIGDSSPSALLDAEAIDEHRRMALTVGFDDFEYVAYGQNLGSAEGHNHFLRRLDTELSLIMNPDAYASPLLLVELLAAMEDPLTGMAEARQLPLEHPKEFDRRTGATGWVSGACFLTRRDAIRAIGGFDSETFFLYCDDVDFAWRMRIAGYRLVYCPSAAIFHDKRLDRDGQVVPTEAEVYYSAEAALMMAWKYSRPDLVEQWSEGLLATGLDTHRRAVEVFRRRHEEGTLPSPLDPEGRVAVFMGNNYGTHRFGYDD